MSIDKDKCVPFVSQYSDCSDGMMCRDCTICSCNAQSKWDCRQADSCAEVFRYPPMDELSLKQAFSILDTEMEDFERHKEVKKSNHVVPTPEDDDVLGKAHDSIEDIKALLRMKRSPIQVMRDDKHNKTVNFYHNLEESNEDNLKKNNTFGTLVASKMEMSAKASRRSNVFNDNSTNSLQIEHKKPIHHINDNKIEDNVPIDHLLHDNIKQAIGNASQKTKDKKLSKLIVSELKPGTEVIGDERAAIMSNVTFAPENDTLIAMAYIAGNLLNKLWSIEKDKSSESFETEILKHEKIADLVELFKEPLSLRQEIFLRNALEHLASAVNKNDGKDLNICETLSSKDKVEEKYNEENKNKSLNILRKSDKMRNVSKDALDKVVNVLNLINKFENIQKDLSVKSNHTVNKNVTLESNLELLKQDEKASLNTFGAILEMITKLLMPNKGGKKIANRIKYQNIFSNTNDIKKKIKNLYNIDLNNATISTKDKLIMDYLTHIEENPDCLLNGKLQRHETKSIHQIEGNILLNLSEFFKIKSYSDIINLLNAKEQPNKVDKQNKKTDIRNLPQSDSVESTTKFISKEKIHVKEDDTLTLAKETLKAHLKTVIEDLVQLQNASKGSNATNINMSDVLPCIYKLLNADKEEATRRSIKPLKNIKAVFDYLKKEIKLPTTRRSNAVGQRPKSAAVWERVIKNLNEKANIKTRRNFEVNKPKSLDEVKNIIENLDNSGSDTYKNVALLSEVLPADRLVLLKTLNADVKRYEKVLEDLKRSVDSNSEVPKQYIKDFSEFADNVDININLNEKVIKNLNKPKVKISRSYKTDARTNAWSKKHTPNKNKVNEAIVKRPEDNIKLTRNQIINHLIKNRIKVYMKAKADDGYINDDMNYEIATKILVYLEQGNDVLARELFKIFAANKRNDSKRPVASPQLKHRQLPSISNKVPLIQFETSKFESQNNDLLKQLLNIKNIKM